MCQARASWSDQPWCQCLAQWVVTAGPARAGRPGAGPWPRPQAGAETVTAAAAATRLRRAPGSAYRDRDGVARDGDFRITDNC
jgi:hypothetical protein